jgi:probable RNA-binding protein EIF1AD
MAGLGRRSLYRKSVTDDYLNGLPEPEEGQFVAKAGASRGGNVIEVLVPDSGSLAEARESSLAILPTKFRKLIWIKRGDFLIVSGATADCENAKGEAGKVEK